MGIEPTLAAWEAAVLPLNYTRPGGADRIAASVPRALASVAARARRGKPGAAVKPAQAMRKEAQTRGGGRRSFSLAGLILSRLSDRAAKHTGAIPP